MPPTSSLKSRNLLSRVLGSVWCYLLSSLHLVSVLPYSLPAAATALPVYLIPNQFLVFLWAAGTGKLQSWLAYLALVLRNCPKNPLETSLIIGDQLCSLPARVRECPIRRRVCDLETFSSSLKMTFFTCSPWSGGLWQVLTTMLPLFCSLILTHRFSTSLSDVWKTEDLHTSELLLNILVTQSLFLIACLS